MDNAATLAVGGHVPDDFYYRVTNSAGTATINAWQEFY
jgi:hypothetical protein